MSLKQLVLLPGLDGTGDLFNDFIEALPQSFVAIPVAYPKNIFLSYADLSQLVAAAVPKSEPFVLLAESFSSPLAVGYAATNPPNLTAVVLCAGFVGNPIPGWSSVAKIVARPWFFRLKPPRFIIEYLLTGEGATPTLVQKLRRALQDVSPEVLSARVQEVLHCSAKDDLARIKVPILYLQAANDKLLSASCRDEIFRHRSDILIKQLPAPHLLLQREPQAAAILVASFINSLTSSA